MPSRLTLPARRVRYSVVDELQLPVPLALEGVAVGAGLERVPEGGRRCPLCDQVAEQPVERADEVLGPLEPAEDLAAELAEHAAEDHGALEVVAGVAAGVAEPGGQLLEGAERRVEPAGDAAGGGEADQVVAQAALAEGQEVAGRRERLVRGRLERGEERLGGPLEQQERVTGDDDLNRAGGEQARFPGLDVVVGGR